MRLGILEPPADCSALFVELADGLLGITLERLFARNVVGQRRFEPLELRQPPRNRVAPRPRGRQLVRQRMALLAQLGQRVALHRQRFRRLVVRCLGFDDRPRDPLDLLGRSSRFRSRRLRGLFGLRPARVDQPRLDQPDLVSQLAVAFGSARLAPKLRRALLLVRQDFRQAGEI